MAVHADNGAHPSRQNVADGVGRALARVAGGRLRNLPFTVRFWDGSELPAGAGSPTVWVRDRRALAHLVREPNQLGLARAWVSGLIDVDDLERALALRDRFQSVHLGTADSLRLQLDAVRLGGAGILRRPSVPSIEAPSRHGRRHTLARDRSSVRHHYDVSNDFYRVLLGPTMVYSCAYFATPDDALEDAQEHKLELICRKLQLVPGERLLDIGCGWGALVIHAGRHHGVRAVGVTLSEPQAALARERIAAEGLEDRVSVRVADYREIGDGPYDKVVSVGMYEHVGRAELPTYARTVQSLLRPGGLFLNHGIARLHSEPPSGDTFISRYIFPDGELHPVADIITALQDSGHEVRDVESLREHYPLTLRRWLANLEHNPERVLELVGPERERAWRLYILGSAQAFEAGDLSVYQVLAARDGAPHGLALERAEWLDPARRSARA
jgi:cyclopropane-fatty-acyl-phospholipid synthase